MDVSVDWKYDYRRSSVFEEIQTVSHDEPDRSRNLLVQRT